jgi:hypothetical protein
VIDQQVWTTELAWYPEGLAGLWKTFKIHPVSATNFLQVINKSSGHHESKMKPVDLYRETRAASLSCNDALDLDSGVRRDGNSER